MSTGLICSARGAPRSTLLAGWSARARLIVLMISALCSWLAFGCSADTETTDTESTAEQSAAARLPGLPGEGAVWVVMKQKASLAGAAANRDWKARGQQVHAALTGTAASSQASLRAFLSQKNVKHRPFWIVNAIRVEADQATIAEIAKRPEVEKIIADGSYSVPQPTQSVQEVEWGLANIRVPEAWDTFGARGDGIVIANVDTGVEFTHPALARQYRGNVGDGSYNHDHNWFDPARICPPGEPCDNAGHGTHTMGTMVGDDGDPGPNQIGVAPSARWIAAKGCESNSCSFESLLASAQWILAPTALDGSDPRPDLRPHIVNNSWGGGGGDEFYRAAVQAWVDAGIFPVFSAGNSGDWGCGSVGSPGDYAESYAVGAYDVGNNIAYFSSRGPSPFGFGKPNIAAPGVSVRSSVPGSGYEWYDGTSMAAPHVAGTIALMWSAAPGLVGDIEGTRALLDETAIDTEDLSCGGDPGNNNVWGEGRLDAFAAVDVSPRGPMGTLQGTVLDAATGSPVNGASVLIQGGVRDRTVTTNALGVYSARLAVGSYQITARAFGYIIQSLSVEIRQDTVTTQDVALPAAPSYSLSGTVSDAVSAPLAGVRVTLLGTPLPPAVTDVNGAFAFPLVPEGEYQLQAIGTPCHAQQALAVTLTSDTTQNFVLPQLTDEFGYSCSPAEFAFIDGTTVLPINDYTPWTEVTLPFPVTLYGQTYETATVTAFGYVQFVSSPYLEWGNGPIPSPSVPNAALYPFWDELYPYYGSSVLTAVEGESPNRKFVIEWRNVGSYWTGELITFEVVIEESGAITMQYPMGDTPWQRGAEATIGLENESGQVAFQYSYDQPVLSSASAVRFSLPPSGTVEGTIVDANDGLPVGGAVVQAFAGENVVRSTRTTAHGFYRLQLPEGTYSVRVEVEGYAPEQVELGVLLDQRLVQNFTLRTGSPSLTPSALQWVLPTDQARTRVLKLSNTGSHALGFTVAEAGGLKQAVAATRTYARNEVIDENAPTTETLFQEGVTPAGWTPFATGDVLRSFAPQGLELPWGVGFTGDVWLSDPILARNTEFTADGTLTGRAWPTSWAGAWAADMAYDYGRNLVCQLDVGGDNGIHCWNQETGAEADGISGAFPWTNTSQRGLAYRADDDSFYVGGWNEGIIYHIKGLSAPDRGTVISSCMPPDGSISGLAYNGSMDVLWVATNSYTDTIYELDPDDCTVLSTLAHPSPYYNGAGLEMDDIGNLWMVSMNDRMAYLMDSGVPAFSDVPWLAVSPASGSVGPGQSAALAVTVNTTGLTPGVYMASVFVVTDAAKQGVLRVPVSVVVSAYQQAVNGGGAAYTDSSGDRWAADQKYIAGSWGYTNKSNVATTRKSIGGTLDPVLYQSQRANPYAYRFDNVPNGIYQVDLRFAELTGSMKNGKRVFDVVVENTLVLPAHDIMYEVGTYIADDHTFFIEVTDARMDVRLVPRTSADIPVINGLRVTHRPDR